MPVGYHRNVPAASPTGPPDAQRICGPLGIQAARRFQKRVCLRRRRSAAFASLHPVGKFALRRCVEQEPAVARLRSRSHNDDRVKAGAATVAVQRENEHQHEKEKYVQGHSPGARCRGRATD
jgi:hypothetical protein